MMFDDLNEPFARALPTFVKVDLTPRPVLAAAFVPARKGELPAHVVLYPNGAGQEEFAVGLLVHDVDQGRSYLTQGHYWMTYPKALEAFRESTERYSR